MVQKSGPIFSNKKPQRFRRAQLWCIPFSYTSHTMPVLTGNDYQIIVIEPNVNTTHFTAPCSSFKGVQCVANFSLPRIAADRRVERLISDETARPIFNVSLILFLKSLVMKGACCARVLKISLPTKGVPAFGLMISMSSMSGE